ncbi:MAG: DNA/RNA non-specific endonuclease [Flavobacteriaceae bacterium]
MIIRLKFLIGFLFVTSFSFSQFNYQSLIRDTNGNVVVNTDIQIRFGIIYDSPTATPIYSEIHQITTPDDGIVNLLIGHGVAQTGSSSFTSIDWSKIVYVKQEVEIDNSGSFIDFGTNKLNSVPVSEFAKSISNVKIDPLHNISIGIDVQTSIVTSNTLPLDGNGYALGNTGVGHTALKDNVTGKENTAVGIGALHRITDGNKNSSLGNGTFLYLTDGSSNTAIGNLSGALTLSGVVTSGDNLTFLGAKSSAGYNNLQNATAIGANATVTSSNTIQLGDNNVTLVNTSGVVSATSFRGNANELSIMSSNTVSSLLSIIEDLQSKISDLTTNLESATTKTYFGRAFQTNIVTQTSIFTVSYNEVYEQPNWLEYTVRNVTANVTRSGDFYGVSGIYTSHEDDYHDNVWDKGHLAPAASYLDSQENLEATFSYLNCALMKDNLNRFEWAQLEDQVRSWASDLGVDIDVRVDVFFDDGHEVLETGAHVPSRFLKTITLPAGYTFPNDTISKKCFEFPNANTNGANWTDFEVNCSS